MSDQGNLPPCCNLGPFAEVAEKLYVAYQRGGPAERAGLAWNGDPCPTWDALLAASERGESGPAGVVAKWRAVAESLTSAMGSQVSLGACTWPAWVKLQLAGHTTLVGWAQATRDPGTIELSTPMIPGDSWHEPLPATASLRPIRGPAFYSLEIITQEEALRELALLRKGKPLEEKRLATTAVMAAAQPGDHLCWTHCRTRGSGTIVSLEKKGPDSPYWRAVIEQAGTIWHLNFDHEPMTLTFANDPDLPLLPDGWSVDEDGDESDVRHEACGLLAAFVSADTEHYWSEIKLPPAPREQAERLHRRVLAAVPIVAGALYGDIGLALESDDFGRCPRLVTADRIDPTKDAAREDDIAF